MTMKILIIDDEEDIRETVQDILEDESYETCVAKNSDEALDIVRNATPDLMILDIWLEDSTLDGIGILQETLKQYPEMPVLMFSGHGTIETAVSAIQLGAYDFIEKPFQSGRLLLLVQRALEASQLKQENRDLKQKFISDFVSDLEGKSSQIQHIRQIIERVAPTSSRVLITGEQGTGKEVAARMVHRLSQNPDTPYVIINCAALEPDRLEEELFGIENVKTGMLEQANGGTLLLDEVADMPLETQGKILRVLQDKFFVKPGGQVRVDTDIRVVSLTGQDLLKNIEKGTFRQDLYYRLNVVPVHMPALKDRKEDIPELCLSILQQVVKDRGLSLAKTPFTNEAMALLQSYEWPGNIRQMRNVMEWVLIMCDTQNETLQVSLDMLPPEMKQDTSTSLSNDANVEMMTKPLKDARKIFEREYLRSQVSRFDGNISKTALFVGMERSALHRKLKSLDIETQKETPAEKDKKVG